MSLSLVREMQIIIAFTNRHMDVRSGKYFHAIKEGRRHRTVQKSSRRHAYTVMVVELQVFFVVRTSHASISPLLFVSKASKASRQAVVVMMVVAQLK
jgi:hypothetical protein